jgi:hypothetical protein
VLNCTYYVIEFFGLGWLNKGGDYADPDMRAARWFTEEPTAKDYPIWVRVEGHNGQVMVYGRVVRLNITGERL